MSEKNSPVKIISMASIGALFECYDFMICAFLSGILIKIFYANNQVFGVFSIFTIAFFARPLGGLFWSHLGDRYGRQKVFSWTMLLLVIPTILIAIFPVNLVSIGVSSYSFMVLRFLQGFLVGGEFPGGVTFIAEIAPPKKRGLIIAIFMAFLTAGTLLASLVSLSLNYFLNEAQIFAWGWRLPFILNLILIIIAIYIRRKVSETPFFNAIQHKKALSKMPILDLLKNYPYLVFVGFIITCCSACGIVTLYTFLPQLLKITHHFNGQQVLNLTTLGTFILCLAMPIAGIWSDRLGRQPIFIYGLIGTLISWYLFAMALYQDNYLLALIAMFITSLFFAGVNANYCVILSEQFPTRVRYSGVAFCYTSAYSLCGGILPLIYLYYKNTPLLIMIPGLCFGLLLILIIIFKGKLNDQTQKMLMN